MLHTSAAGPCLSTVSFVAPGPTVPTCVRSATRSAGENICDNNVNPSLAPGNVLASRYTSTVQRLYPTVAASPSQRESNILGSSALREFATWSDNYHRKTQVDTHSQVVPSSPSVFRDDSQSSQGANAPNAPNQTVASSAAGLYGLRPASCTAHNRFNFNAAPRHLEQYAHEETHIQRPQIWITNGHRREGFMDHQMLLVSQSPPGQYLGMTQQPRHYIQNRQRSPLVLHRGPNNMAGDQLNRVVRLHVPGPHLVLQHPTQSHGLQRGPYYVQHSEPANARLDTFQAHEQAGRRCVQPASVYEHFEHNDQQPYRGQEYQEYRSPLDLSASTERLPLSAPGYNSFAPGSHSFETQTRELRDTQRQHLATAQQTQALLPSQQRASYASAAAADVVAQAVHHSLAATEARGQLGAWAPDSRGAAPPMGPRDTDDTVAAAKGPHLRPAAERREVEKEPIQQNSGVGALLSLAALAEAACHESAASDDGMDTMDGMVHPQDSGLPAAARMLAAVAAAAPSRHEPAAPSSVLAPALQSSNLDSISMKMRAQRPRAPLALGGGRGLGRTALAGGAAASESEAVGTSKARDGGSQESLLRTEMEEPKEETKWGIEESLTGGDGIGNVKAAVVDGLRMQSLLMVAAEAAAEGDVQQQQPPAPEVEVGEAGVDGESEAVSAAAAATASGRGAALPITVRRPLNGKPYIMRPTWRSRGDDNYLKLPPNILKALTRQQRNGSEAVPVTIRFTSAAIIQPYGESCTTADEEDALDCFVSRKGPGGCLALQVPVSWRMHGRRLLYTKLRQDLVLELGLGEILEEVATPPSNRPSWRALSKHADDDRMEENEDELSQDPQTPLVAGSARAPQSTAKRVYRRSSVGGADQGDDGGDDNDAGPATADGVGNATAATATAGGEDSAPKAKRRRSSTSTPFSPSPPRRACGAAAAAPTGDSGAGGATEDTPNAVAARCSPPVDEAFAQPQRPRRVTAGTRSGAASGGATKGATVKHQQQQLQQRGCVKAGQAGHGAREPHGDAIKSDVVDMSKMDLRAVEELSMEAEVTGQQAGETAAGSPPAPEMQLLRSYAGGVAPSGEGVGAATRPVGTSEQEMPLPLTWRQERVQIQQQQRHEPKQEEQKPWAEDQLLRQKPQLQLHSVQPGEHVMGTLSSSHTACPSCVKSLPPQFARSRVPQGHLVRADVDAEPHAYHDQQTEGQSAAPVRRQAAAPGPSAGQNLAEAAHASLHVVHPVQHPVGAPHAVARSTQGGPVASGGPAAVLYRTTVSNRAPEPAGPASGAARNVAARSGGGGAGSGGGGGEGPRVGPPWGDQHATLTAAAAGAASALLGRTWTLLEEVPDAQRAAGRALAGAGRLQQLPPGLPPAEATAALNDFRGLLDSAALLLYRAQEARQVAATAVTASVADIDLITQRWQALGGQGGGRGAAASVAAEAGKVWRCLLDAAPTLHWAVDCLLRLYGSFEVAAEEGFAVSYAVQSRGNGTLVLTQVAEALEPLMRPESSWLWV